MRSIVCLLALAFFVSPLSAQTAMSVPDAQRLATDHVREVQPAIAAVNQEARTLATISGAAHRLNEFQPATGIDEAIHLIADFVQKEDRAGHPLTMELQRLVNQARDPIA